MSKDFFIFYEKILQAQTSMKKHNNLKSIKDSQAEAQNCEEHRDACKRISNFVLPRCFLWTFWGV